MGKQPQSTQRIKSIPTSNSTSNANLVHFELNKYDLPPERYLYDWNFIPVSGVVWTLTLLPHLPTLMSTLG